MIQSLRKLVREEGRYPLEAYLFVYQALEHAQKQVGKRRHISGKELLEGFRDLAIESFGPLALMVFHHWNLRRTDDVGVMVFHLIQRELMGKTEDDQLEDFEGLYDFEETFNPETLLGRIDAQELTPNYRIPLREFPGATRAPVSQA